MDIGYEISEEDIWASNFEQNCRHYCSGGNRADSSCSDCMSHPLYKMEKLTNKEFGCRDALSFEERLARLDIIYSILPPPAYGIVVPTFLQAWRHYKLHQSDSQSNV